MTSDEFRDPDDLSEDSKNVETDDWELFLVAYRAAKEKDSDGELDPAEIEFAAYEHIRRQIEEDRRKQFTPSIYLNLTMRASRTA